MIDLDWLLLKGSLLWTWEVSVCRMINEIRQRVGLCLALEEWHPASRSEEAVVPVHLPNSPSTCVRLATGAHCFQNEVRHNPWWLTNVETSIEQTRMFCLYLVQSEGLLSSVDVRARNLKTKMNLVVEAVSYVIVALKFLRKEKW